MGERHSPSPSVRIRFSVFVEDSKASAAAAAANFAYIFQVICSFRALVRKSLYSSTFSTFSVFRFR